MSPDVGINREWLGAQLSLKFFTVKFLGLRWCRHYQEWDDLLAKNERILIQAPRGSWKSYFFSLAYPLWRIIRGKTDILMVSDSEDQSRKNLRIMREIVEQRPCLAPLAPSTKELWGTDQAQFRNGSLVEIMGFGTSKRGTHPDVIINDDIESERNKMSRDEKSRMYFAVISGMAITGRTKLITVGTPLDFGDLLEQTEQRRDEKGVPIYAQWKRPAEINGASQFPELWDAEALRFKRAEMGALNYAREMLLERIDPSTQPFKRDFETLYEVAPDRERYMFVGTICDPAYTEGDGDYTAIVTAGVTHGNHAYALAVKRIRREDPGLIVDELFKQIDAYKPDSVGIKRRKGDAIAFTFNERRTRENRWDFRYVELKDTKSKTDKSRIGGLVPRWEARTIHIHKHMTEFLEEIYSFRLDDSHRNDDMLDAFADIFNPEMAKPNGGKFNVPLAEKAAAGRAFYNVGRRPSPDADGQRLLGLVA